MSSSVANVYIDGFNLYYLALRHTAFKWLDVSKLASAYLGKGDKLGEIKYFTARVKPRPQDPQQPARQQLYLRALGTIPNLSIHFGMFQSTKKRMALADGSGKTVEVIKTEEKGSDVNLAVQLVNDAHLGKFSAALVVSNDSDLSSAIRIVTKDLGLTVGVLAMGAYPSSELRKQATFMKRLRSGVLNTCQFPKGLADANGRFHKPPEWDIV